MSFNANAPKEAKKAIKFLKFALFAFFALKFAIPNTEKGLGRFITPRLWKDTFQSPRQFPACQQHPPLADCTLQANIRPQADNGPLVGAAGMGFTQAQEVVELEVG